MRVIEDPWGFQQLCNDERAKGRRIGLVLTMGALHEGHLSLVRLAREHCDVVVLTIFVNPTQFGPGEDLARYPRDRDTDLALCREHGVGIVFIPQAEAMYDSEDATRVHVQRLTEGLCGASRPRHFDGVCTVVSKLFNLTGPCVAVFGRKDYQQLRVIARMARDLFFPIRIVEAQTLREPDGLALSSRNRRLSAAQRETALSLVSGLSEAQRGFERGERDAAALRGLVRRRLRAAGAREDYVVVADDESLAPLDGTVPQRALLAVAAHVGDVRLIDNVVLGVDAPLVDASGRHA